MIYPTTEFCSLEISVFVLCGMLGMRDLTVHSSSDLPETAANPGPGFQPIEINGIRKCGKVGELRSWDKGRQTRKGDCTLCCDHSILNHNTHTT
jgi:hypothetical protein